MHSAKMDRSQIVIAKSDELDRRDAEYWSRASVDEKLQTISARLPSRRPQTRSPTPETAKRIGW
jgi:Cu/Ag efflux pump CusA